MTEHPIRIGFAHSSPFRLVFSTALLDNPGMRMSKCPAFGGIDALDSGVATFDFPPHAHSEIVVAIYRTGHKHYTCHRRTGDLRRGDLLVIGSDVAHSARASACQYLSIYPSLQQIAAATGLAETEVASRIGVGFHLGAEADALRLADSMLLTLSESRNADAEAAMSSFLAQVLAMARSQPVTKAPAHLDRVRQCLHEHADQDHDLAALAAQLCVSAEHLCRAFKASYGVAPFQYLRARRVALARDCIRAGMSLADAASHARFADQSHMARWFYRVLGVAPGYYQKSCCPKRHAGEPAAMSG